MDRTGPEFADPWLKSSNILGLIDLQKSLGDRLLEAYNEEHFIQEELKDIRTMNKQKYLEEKTIMSDERKVKKGSRRGSID